LIARFYDEGMRTVILQEDFKRLVEEQLVQRDWSRADLARAMNKSRQYVTNYLNGNVSPGPDVIEAFFAAFECRVHLTVTPIGQDAKPRGKKSAVPAA